MPLSCTRSCSLLLVAVSIGWITSTLRAEDSITLTTGEIVAGRITAETDQQMEIEVANADRTILSKRRIARAIISSVQRETPEQTAERKSFESLARYKLDPNSAFPTNYYPAVIGALDKFLASWPHSDHAAQVSAQRAAWKAEYPQALLAAQKGLVKFRGQWLTPQQTQALANEERAKQEAVHRQEEQAHRRQAEETNRQQQQSEPDKKSAPVTHINTGGYQVDVNSVAPY